MKRVLFTLSLVALLAAIGIAQEEPIPPKRSKAAKIGGLIGYTPGWLFMDTKPINEFIVPAKGAALKESGVYLNGIGGSAYIIFVPNLRVGGFRMWGKSVSTSLDGFGLRRDVEMDVSFGGVSVEYVFPIVERLDVAVGATLGGGSLSLTLRQDNGGSVTWNGEWGNFGNPGNAGPLNNMTRKLSGSYFVYVPSVNVEYALLGWVGVRLGVSYVGMASPSWQVDDKYDLLGVPSKISGKGFMINAGLFVGTF